MAKSPVQNSVMTSVSHSAFGIPHSAFADAEVREPPRSLGATIRHLGPGLILSASIVGSGELIVTPKLGAAVGFSLLWFIIIGCVLKLFVQVELARVAIAERLTTLEAMDRVPGPRLHVSWLLWLWLGMYVGLALQLGGIIGGIVSVVQSLGATWSPLTLLVLVATSCAVLLVTGRYRLVESVSMVMVCLFSLCTVVAVLALQWTPYRISGADLLHGLSFQIPPSFTIAFAAFGIIGVGASELIYYPYWCLEKGYARFAGPREQSQAWLDRANGWLRVMKLDAWVSLVIYTGATAAFYLLGAAVLHARDLQVTDQELIPTLAQMYEQTLGWWGSGIFLVGAFIVLYSTFFVATASNARLFADGLSVFRLTRYDDPSQRFRMVRVACVLLPAISAIVYYLWPRPVGLVLIGALGQGLMLPFLAGAAVYFRHTRMPRALEEGWVWTTALWLSAISMAAVGLYQAWQTIK
jgi:manganese transport protein